MSNRLFIMLGVFVFSAVIGMGVCAWVFGGWIGIIAYIGGILSTTILPDLICRKPEDRIYFR